MSKWRHLAARFENNEQPRKLLALDGGGIRGVLTLEILAEIENKLRARSAKGEKFRLCDYFDYIGGTSTGSIIAAGLAIGMSVEELLKFYTESGEAMFAKTFLLERLKNLYKDEPLARKLKEIFHDGKGNAADLTTERLRCLLLVVTRNWSTDSPWPISTNPFAKYNELTRPDCNLRIPLWQLVRASTAAPVFFPPEVMQWDKNDPKKTFAFVDGGITPYNNPAFLLYRMATQPAYRLNWRSGERNLLLVSVGTGAAPGETTSTSRDLLGNLKSLTGELMYAVQNDQDINCRTFGRCVHGAEIDREMGSLVLPDKADDPGGGDHGRFFRYVRYNADLSQRGLEALGVGDIPSAAAQQMDAVDQIDNLRRIGRAVAREVQLSHFGAFEEAKVSE